MIRRKADQKIEFKCIRNGNGDAELHGITNSVEELYGKGRLFEHMFLAPGRSIGEHTHVGDNEIFYFLKGTGRGRALTTTTAPTSRSAPAIRRSAMTVSSTALSTTGMSRWSTLR